MSETNKNKTPEKERLYRYGSKQIVRYSPSLVHAFLSHVIRKRKLPIARQINKLVARRSFFLIAATGLGKTLTIPLWLLYRHMASKQMRPPLAEGEEQIASESPRVWVVEPKVAICQGLEATLNGDWESFCETRVKGPTIPMFGCKTKTDNVSTNAPIVFITTGIFAIYARNGMFKSGRDVVLIDEAHSTLESDEGVELGVTLCRAFNVDINYMSATVDPVGLEKALGIQVFVDKRKRQHIWRHNTGAAMEDCIVDLVRKTLVEQDRASEYVPSADTPHADVITSSVFEEDRAKGLLILVNSYASENSEAKRIERLLRREFPGQPFEIGQLAGETLRNRRKKAEYEQMLERWKDGKKRYVLIATSVVEMGVTLPSLDYVVTPDCDFEGEPLGVNSLIQRMGRVGRERPGIAYITQEAGASYSELDDAALNAPGALAPEPIRFPIKEGHVTGLAHLTLQWKWPALSQVEQLTGALPIPSFDEASSAELFVRYQKEYARLIALGIGRQDPPGLTPDGILMERWIGRADLADAMEAQRAYQANNPTKLFYALVRCARFNVAERDICAIPFNDMDKTNKVQTQLRRLCIDIVQYPKWNLASCYAADERLERIAGFLTEYDGHWGGFIRYVKALIEAIEIMHKVNPEDPNLKRVRRNMLNWYRYLKAFVASFDG